MVIFECAYASVLHTIWLLFLRKHLLGEILMTVRPFLSAISIHFENSFVLEADYMFYTSIITISVRKCRKYSKKKTDGWNMVVMSEILDKVVDVFTASSCEGCLSVALLVRAQLWDTRC